MLQDRRFAPRRWTDRGENLAPLRSPSGTTIIKLPTNPQRSVTSLIFKASSLDTIPSEVPTLAFEHILA